MEKLTRKYGLLTAICMVVGTVIGSGLFFKSQNVLVATGGDMPLGIVAWIISGVLMIICSAQFAVMATKYQKVNGVVDFAEATCGKSYAYYLAWFLANIYYPGMTGVLAWVSARYFGVLFGWSMVGPEVLMMAGFFMIAMYAMNAFSPKLAGKFQVSATVIKLIPIGLMAIVGTVAGLVNGTLTTNFTTVVTEVAGGKSSGLFAAVIATVFAYEGWIVTTSINAELKDPKKNLPLALVIGSFVVVFAYVMYYIGVAGGATNAVLMEQGATTAFTNIFGGIGGTILNVFIVISCLGTLNGLILAVTRGMYSIAARNEGPSPRLFIQIDPCTNAVTNSSVWGLLVSVIWLVYFYGANLTDGWFGIFNFDSSELPIVTIYAMYIPMLIAWMKKEKDEPVFRRLVLPSAAILACVFMIFAAIYAHGITPFLQAKANGEFSFPVLFYCIVFALIMGAGALVKKPRRETELKKTNGVVIMELKEIAEKLGVDSYPEELDALYSQLRDSDAPACDVALIDRLQEEYDIFGEFYNLVRQAAQIINDDAICSAWVKTVAAYAMDRTMKQAHDIPVPRTDGTLAGDFLPLYILLPMIPVAIDDYKARGFEGEDLANILKEYKVSIRIVERQTGRPGIDQTYYGWLMIFAKAEIFCTMGLQFQIYNLPKMALWLRNRQTGQVVPLMVRGEFHASGVQQLGSKGYEDAEGSICPDFSEDDRNFYGYGVFDNVMSTQRQTFPKDVWECVGRPGDVCLNIHVPRGSDISRETVLAACADAKKIAAKRYPELPEIRLVLGVSWLLNPTLKQIQGEQARTTQFMECFTKYPNRDVDGSSMIKFVFGKAYEDYNDLPEDTSLQRKMKRLYLEGGCLHKYTGTIYIEMD